MNIQLALMWIIEEFTPEWRIANYMNEHSAPEHQLICILLLQLNELSVDRKLH